MRRLGYGEIQKVHWNNSEMHFYSANVIGQTLHKLASITVLIDKGLSSDAWLLARSLIETALDHDYILRNPAKFDLYLKYSSYLDLQYIERIEARRALSSEEQSEYEKLKRIWESNKHIFTKNGRVRKAWRDKSLEEIGKEVKLTNIYSLFYREANDYVHGNSNLTRNFILGKTEEGLLVKAGGTYDERDITLITSATLALVLLVLMRANKFYELGFNNEIRELDKRIIGYRPDIKK